MRSTSAMAYREALKTGLITSAERMVLRDIIRNPHSTQGEVASRITEVKNHTITPRFRALVDKGVLAECGKRPCSTSGKKCLIYKWTGNAPAPIAKKKNKDGGCSFDKEEAIAIINKTIKLCGDIEAMTNLQDLREMIQYDRNA